MDQRKLMDNANTITDMAKVRFCANKGNLHPLVKLDGILQQRTERIEGDYISKLPYLLR